MAAWATGGHKDAECTNSLIYMLAVDNMPLRSPEKKGMKRFVKSLQPAFQLPSETVTTRLLEEKYEVMRRRVSDWIAVAPNVSLTSDIWTHKYTLKSYLGVTVHFQKGNELKTLEISARHLTQRKDADYLAQVLTEICAEWKIDIARVRGVTTDGGANIRLAVRNVFGPEKHVTCLAHVLNLIGQKVIGNRHTLPSEVELDAAAPPAVEVELEDGDFHVEAEEREATGNALRMIIVKTKKVVRFFKQSKVASTKLFDLQVADGVPPNKCLKHIQEVRTRFNSCFDMCERYLTLAPYTARVIFELQRTRASRSPPPEVLTAVEETTLMEIRDLLAPLARATAEISGEKLCTISKSIPVVRNLVRNVKKVVPTTSVGTTMQRHILDLVKEKLANIEDVRMYAAATLLDPRFKKLGFNQEEVTAPRRVANAVNFVGGLVKAKMAEAANAEQEARAALPAPPSNPAEDDFWGDHDMEVERHSALQSNQDVAGGIPVQLRQYLDRPVVDRRANPDPLLAWASAKSEYKAVYDVASAYLIIMGTSIPSERLFSHAGLIATPIKSRMSPKHIEMLVFLQSCDDELWFP